MKKNILIIGAATLLLAACSNGNGGQTTTNSASRNSDFGEITATITKQDGKVTAIDIDKIQDGKSTKDLGSEYGMKKASKIGKEWDEQIISLEQYMLKNGIDSVKLDSEGYPENEDLKSECTISLSTIMDAVKEANAK